MNRLFIHKIFQKECELLSVNNLGTYTVFHFSGLIEPLSDFDKKAFMMKAFLSLGPER